MNDFYVLLGVQRDASDGEIKKAYRKLAMEYHPDRNSAPDAEARFKEITEAYEVLRDPQKRAAYDRYGKAGVGSGAGGGFGFHHVDLSEALNIFMRDFGGMSGFESLFGGGSRADTRRGQDVRVTVRLSLSDVATGVKKTVKFKALERCRTCEGTRSQGRDQADPMHHLQWERRSASRGAKRVRAVRFRVAMSDLRGRGLGHPSTVRGLPRRGSGACGAQRPGRNPGRCLDQQLPHASGPGGGGSPERARRRSPGHARHQGRRSFRATG